MAPSLVFRSAEFHGLISVSLRQTPNFRAISKVFSEIPELESYSISIVNWMHAFSENKKRAVNDHWLNTKIEKMCVHIISGHDELKK